MKVKKFYLIDSPKINELNETEKNLLEKQLIIYHTPSSSIVDKSMAIYTLIGKDGIEKLRFEYNLWLYDFVNYQLKTNKTKEENEALKKVLAHCYHVFGLKSCLEGNTKTALDNYKKSIKIREKLNDSTAAFKTCYNMALIFHMNGNFANAIKFYEKCIELGREIEDKTSLARIFNNLHFLLINRGNFSKSLNYLYKALSLYKKNNDKKGIAMIYHNIGCALASQLEIDEALKYFLESFKLSESVGYDFQQITNCVEIGSIYQQKGENDTALKYYLKAVNLPQIDHWYNYAYFRIGTLYEEQNKIDLAMDYYNKSLQLSEKIEHKELYSKALSKIGALEIKRGDIEKASIQINRAFKLAKELNNLEQIKEAATAKLFLAIAIEDYKLAYEMEKLKNEMREKILNNENTKVVIKHQLKYEYEKQLKQKDIEIEYEKQNNQHLLEQIDLLSAKNKQLTSKNKIIIEQLAEIDG